MTVATTIEFAGCLVDAIRPIVRRYWPWVTEPDVSLYLWRWYRDNGSRIDALLQAGETAAVTRKLRTQAERYAREEKALQEGYSPSDEVFYSLRTLREILPDALDPNAIPSQQWREVSVATSKLGYGEWEAGIADVRRALAQMSPNDRILLAARYRLGLSPDDMAQVRNVDTATVYAQLGRALRRLQRRLGGPAPT